MGTLLHNARGENKMSPIDFFIALIIVHAFGNFLLRVSKKKEDKRADDSTRFLENTKRAD